MLLEGTRLGRYQLLRQVSSGGMGTIFLAQDSHMPRQVAVKVVRIDNELQQNSSSAHQVERPFYREIEAISRLDHPHILPIFDFGKEKIDKATYIYLVMPFRAEGSLAEWLRHHQSNERLSSSETATLLIQAADALQHAHEHHIVHQDVKPSNFLLRSRTTQPEALPDLLLTDFGIAQFLSAASSQSHAVRGTPLFMAPEQWDGNLLRGKILMGTNPGEVALRSRYNPTILRRKDITPVFCLVQAFVCVEYKSCQPSGLPWRPAKVRQCSKNLSGRANRAEHLQPDSDSGPPE